MIATTRGSVVRSVWPVGVAAALGAVVGSWWSGAAASRSLPLVPKVHAVSATADDSFAVCTAPIDGGFEGFFMLDYQTGDLSGGVLNQATGTFTGVFRKNVLADLKFEPGAAKQPRFLLVSGMSNVRRSQAGPLASSVLYVTDSSTGATAAYGIPWNPQQAQKGFASELVLLDVANPRGAAP
jgi:hypothetical protein